MVQITPLKAGPRPTALPFGGTDLCVNSLYLEKGGKPWLPVMGEFHFSRYPKAEWERELLKMRAGGVEIVATYVFWIYHEEEEGVWDFSGDRNLRDFILLHKKHSIPLILRIGPWAHGECRNGGFPDWLLQKPLEARSNDPAYLRLAENFYARIFEEARGLLWKDGGPILGIQIENEYGHCGGFTGEKGLAHMKKLKEIALHCGFELPLYTATAWGGAMVADREVLPVMGGYVDAPWDQSLSELPENPNFLIQAALNDPLIGSDHKKDGDGSAFTCKINDYPYLTAELGGGMQPTEHRRVVAFPRDTLALAFCKLASGANLLGYYMYHGGTNPTGKFSTLEESRASGFPNNLPVKSYDFQAPIGECGALSASYGLLGRLHLFLQEFGPLLAPARAYIPAESAREPADLHTLRFSLRHNSETGGGFVFINNHLRKRTLKTHENLALQVGDISLPPVTVHDGDCLILPYNLPLGDALLESSNATPLTRIGNRWFFWCREAPIYRFAKGSADIVTLSPQEAAKAYRFGDKLYLADCPLYAQEGRIYAQVTGETQVQIYGPAGEPQSLTLTPPAGTATCDLIQQAPGLYNLNLHYQGSFEDCILTLDFLGDKAALYLGETLIADWFTTGLPFRIALARHGYPKTLRLAISPSQEGRYFDLPVQPGCALTAATLLPLYRLAL